jgi:oligopeptide transport system permease protein
MLGFIIKRLLQIVPLVVIIMTATFFLMRLAPGNPFANERQLPAAVKENMNRRFGLDRPMFYVTLYEWTELDNGDISRDWVFRWNGLDNQYHNYFFWRRVPNQQTGELETDWGVIAFDFGPSTRFTDERTVTDVILAGLPISVTLGLMAYIFALCIGVPIGTIAGYRQNSMLDYTSMAAAIIGISIPALVVAPVLVLVFSLQLYLFPPATVEYITVLGVKMPNLKYLVLPAVALSAVYAAYIARLMRAGMLETMRADYVRTARAKGLTERQVIIRHAMRGAILPVVSFTGPALAFLLAGTIVVESIFALGGLGTFFKLSAQNRDYPLTLGIVFFVSIVLIVMNLLVDIAYAYIDPRIKYS